MPEQTIQLDLTLVAPTLTDEHDVCWTHLLPKLQALKGVQKAHLVTDQQPTQLCLHYDSDRVSSPQVQRMATEHSGAFTDRYRHEQIIFAKSNAAHSSEQISTTLKQLEGVLHVNVDVTAGLVLVGYDSNRLQRTTIYNTIRTIGIHPTSLKQNHQTDPAHDVDTQHDAHAGHNHGSAPAFLPHWIQEHWSLILVALAGLFFLAGWMGSTFFSLDPTITLVFFVLSYVAGGYDVATHAIPGLFKGVLDTDILMLAAAVGAAILGEWSEGAFLLFLFALGHAGEHYALDRARHAVNALGQLMPNEAQRKQGDIIERVPVTSLQIDDVVIVRPGDRVPVDGVVVDGRSTVDQSPITGESLPVSKSIGDELFAGTVNVEGALNVRVTKLAKDNMLARIMQLVAEAQSQQSPTQQLTQRFTSRFVPAVLIATLLLMVVPPLVGWMAWQASFYRAMLLLVAASPCALALGTPATVLTGIAQAARHGILIKGGVHLENLGALKVMAFDKTGTLTAGQFTVTDVVSLDGTSESRLLSIIGSVEQQSNHPLAQAVVEKAKSEGAELISAEAIINIPGRGIQSSINGKPVMIGNRKLFATHPSAEQAIEIMQRLESHGRTTMAVSYDGHLIGVLGLADTPRLQAKKMLTQLRNLGVQHLVMLTGDNSKVANQIATAMGITDVRAELLPQHKLTAIEELQMQYGDIAMTGDGVNDAPALATATVGIAMGGAGTAVALETADVALMGDDLSKLPFAVGLSRASRRIIRQNLAVSLGVIALLLVTSVFGLIELSGAVILHEGSTLIVVLNALRLLGYRHRD